MLRGWQRRALAAGPPIVVVASSWGALQVNGTVSPFYAVVALSLLATLPRLLPVRLGVAVALLGGLTLVGADSSTDRASAVADRGLADISTTAAPFDGSKHRELYLLVVVAAAAFSLAVAVCAGSHPFLAAAVITAGVCIPATLLPPRNTVATGAFCLLVAMWPIVVRAAADRFELARGSWALAAVTGVAIVAVGVGGAGRSAALNWQDWELFGESRVERTIALVWDANYNGVDFPRDKTTVLRITAPRLARYWRATTLDLFTSDRWVESLPTREVGDGSRRLPADPLLPAAAAAGADRIKQQVDVRVVVDDHLVAVSQPVQVGVGAADRLQIQAGGVMRAVDGLDDVRRYTVWSYSPRPTPEELVGSPPTYPFAVERYRDLGRTTMPPFGQPQRGATVSAVFEDARYQALWPYRAIWVQAQRVAAGATSPYEATVRIERWLRRDGGFSYEEHPPRPPAGVPPLVDFVRRAKLGYCQQFAGTMALSLRMLGIPARVAVGFTSGKWKDGTWTVTDHDAHAWVEAWFAGHGWLTFDPTPGQGTFSADYTIASDSADAIQALGTRFTGTVSQVAEGETPKPVPPEKQSKPGRPVWPLAVPLAVLLALLLAPAAVKLQRRRRRAATEDPRGRASAARAELVDYLRDQGSAIRPGAPIGEIVAELRRLGIAGDGFAAAFTEARFGRPEVAPAAAAQARLELGRIVARLRERAGAAKRARGFVAVRSLRGS